MNEMETPAMRDSEAPREEADRLADEIRAELLIYGRSLARLSSLKEALWRRICELERNPDLCKKSARFRFENLNERLKDIPEILLESRTYEEADGSNHRGRDSLLGYGVWTDMDTKSVLEMIDDVVPGGRSSPST